jgi:beta-glucosidase
MDVFIRPFAALIGEAKVESIMNAYHENDGIPAGACRELLTEILREKLGFTGHVASDYFTLPSLHNYHNIAVDEEEAALLGLEAGIDVELPELQVYHAPIKEVLAKGKLSIDLVDNSVRRVLRSKFRLGLFERPYAEGGDIVEVFGAPSNRDLARKVAEKSIVLLKNKNGVLPIKPDVGTIAAIGPGAGSRRLMQGDYHYPAHHELLFGPIPTHEGLPPQTLSREMQGRLNGLIGPQPGGSSARSEGIDYSEHMPKMVTVLEGIRRNAKGLNVIYERGCGVYDEDADGISKAVEAARRADVAIVVVGEKSGLHPGCTAGEFRDRATLHLPGSQRRLVEEVASTGVKTVVVLLNGRPLATPWLEERADAILEAWLPGQEGGSAIADILFGKTSPGGRLPVSMPRDAGQMPSYYNHKPSGRFSKPFKDYADMPVSPLYGFGFGLSYTSFEYSDGRVEPEEVATDKSVDITITVANAGKMAGDEVVQLYVRDVAGSTTRPVRELKGFTRVHLAPGERKRVTFRLDMSQLAFHGRSGRLCTEPGEVEIMVGSSSETFYFRKTISVVGKEKEYRFTTIKPTTVLVS